MLPHELTATPPLWPETCCGVVTWVTICSIALTPNKLPLFRRGSFEPPTVSARQKNGLVPQQLPQAAVACPGRGRRLGGFSFAPAEREFSIQPLRFEIAIDCSHVGE
jgi:hypothetical protein